MRRRSATFAGVYSREQASRLRQAFWAAFGQYLAPHPAAEGGKVNWLNYRTGLKHVHFRMRADNRVASVAIEITHPDAEIRELFFEQFTLLREVLHHRVGETWEWRLRTEDENGRILSRIYRETAPVNVFDQNDWSALISFFKPRILALDEFWSDARYSFDKWK